MQHNWPSSVRLIARNWPDGPWALPEHCHAVVARGHDRDAESVHALLERGAERVYLIASARRAESIIDTLSQTLTDVALLERLSSPAGLDLGGQSSGAIALSILAEIQWRISGGVGQLRPAYEFRDDRLAHSLTGQRNIGCPGQR